MLCVQTLGDIETEKSLLFMVFTPHNNLEMISNRRLGQKVDYHSIKIITLQYYNNVVLQS